MSKRLAGLLRVTGTVTLEWEDGTRIQVSPASLLKLGQVHPPVSARGRKPLPATAKLIEILRQDAAANKRRSRSEYIRILRAAGYAGASGSAEVIVTREMQRAFSA